MIKRPFDENALYGDWNGYADWKKRASTAQQAAAARAAGVAHEFDSKIWRDLKDRLLRFFFDKCAYCEVKITPGFWGDVEHYRPKKRVTEDPAHPGYYWLAYEVRNLMPSCQRCNQGGAKVNHFPIAGKRMNCETDSDGEDPLLLNPYVHKPEEHLEFLFGRGATPTGAIRHRTELGRQSIEIYKLDRPDLTEERREAQVEAINGMKISVQEKTAREYIKNLVEGRKAYSAARLAAALAWWQDYKKCTDEDVNKAIGT